MWAKMERKERKQRSKTASIIVGTFLEGSIIGRNMMDDLGERHKNL